MYVYVYSTRALGDVCSRRVRVNSVRINKDFDKVLSRCAGGGRGRCGTAARARCIDSPRNVFSAGPDGKSRGRIRAPVCGRQ